MFVNKFALNQRIALSVHFSFYIFEAGSIFFNLKMCVLILNLRGSKYFYSVVKSYNLVYRNWCCIIEYENKILRAENVINLCK